MKTVIYHKAKRAKKKQINKKKVVTCIIWFFIICAVIYLLISNDIFELKEKENTESVTENIVQNETATSDKEQEIQEDETSDIEILENMGDYKVLGQLVIEKIGVTKNILNISEDASLKLSVAKLYGPNVNSSGNFCISGHNWNNMLKRLSEMQVGDVFYIVNRETKTKVNYKIYNIYTCVPEDLSCLDQNHDGKREVTLITCNPGGLTRLICKAREI